MKNTKQQVYKFEEFNEHVSLWNMIPAGDGASLVLLRKILDGIQSGAFNRAPSIFIIGEGADIYALALANSLCSGNVRHIEGRYLTGTNDQVSFWGDSLFDTVHIINEPQTTGLNESVIWHILKNRVCKFRSFDRNNVQYIHVNGTIILTATDLKRIPSQLIRASNFKVIIDSYTQQQLELIVHQRLNFCGVDYGDNEDILKSIIEYGNGNLNLILDFLKVCILMIQSEGEEKLNLKLIERASKLI